MSEPTSSPLPPAATVNGDKLSGQLIIKVQLGDDIRKMMIHNEDLTLNGKHSKIISITMKIISSLFRTRSNDGTDLCWKNLQFR